MTEPNALKVSPTCTWTTTVVPDGYSVRSCRGHWHVVHHGEDIGPEYATLVDATTAMLRDVPPAEPTPQAMEESPNEYERPLFVVMRERNALQAKLDACQCHWPCALPEAAQHIVALQAKLDAAEKENQRLEAQSQNQSDMHGMLEVDLKAAEQRLAAYDALARRAQAWTGASPAKDLVFAFAALAPEAKT